MNARYEQGLVPGELRKGRIPWPEVLEVRRTIHLPISRLRRAATAPSVPASGRLVTSARNGLALASLGPRALDPALRPLAIEDWPLLVAILAIVQPGAAEELVGGAHMAQGDGVVQTRQGWALFG